MKTALKMKFLVALLLGTGLTAFGQARSTASRLTDLQIGGGFTTANSDYLSNRIRGFAFYTDFDFKEHFGAELSFHQLNDPKTTQVYERTYEVGGRYVRHYGQFHPYAKGIYGRGVFNFPQSQANLAYNIFAVGGGVDYRVHSRVNIRGDFEYQVWRGFPPNGLSPSLFTIGAAYHFPAGNPR